MLRWAAEDWPSEARLILGSGPDRSRSRRSSVMTSVEPLALDELHGVEADVSILAHLVDRHDVGVVQSCGGAGLAAEPLLDHPVAGDLPRQDLERNAAAQRDLLGLVNDAHAAPADLAEDPVVADFAQGWIRGRRIPAIERLVALAGTPSACSTLTIAGKSSRISSASSGIAVGVFLERRAFAAAEAIRKFLGQLIEQVVLFRFRDRHRSSSSLLRSRGAAGANPQIFGDQRLETDRAGGRSSAAHLPRHGPIPYDQREASCGTRKCKFSWRLLE